MSSSSSPAGSLTGKLPEDVMAEAEKLLSTSKPTNPELENFLSQVDEISEVVRCLSSGDWKENERGLRKADILLNNSDRDIDEAQVKVKASRSIINKLEDKREGEEMSQDAFMRMVEKDAKERGENRRLRKEKSDAFKDQGVQLFRKGDYAAALSKFNQAIEWTKDSPLLYNNRALTYIRLELYSKAIEDCDKALFICESNCKAYLYKAKAYCLLGDMEACRRLLEQAREKCPDNQKTIQQYEKELFARPSAAAIADANALKIHD